MNKLSMEFSITSDATPDKPILQAKISLESLSAMKQQHGEQAVKEALFNIFSRMMKDLKSPTQNS